MNIYFTGVLDREFQDTVTKYLMEFEPMLRNSPEAIEVNLSPRLRVTGGRAHIRSNKIELNYKLLKVNTENIRLVVGHELAHLMDYWENNIVGHGPTWKSIMDRLGVDSRRTHSMNVVAFKNQTKRHKYKCLCREVMFSTRAHNKIQRGLEKRCLRCYSTFRYFSF